jgi:hypothetical protein
MALKTGRAQETVSAKRTTTVTSAQTPDVRHSSP